MIEFRAEETIDRPAAEIWAVAVDVARHPEWMAVTESVIIAGDFTKPGGRARQTMRLGPLRFSYEAEVARAEPGKVVRWRIVGKSTFQGEAGLELTPISADSTRVVYSGSMGFRGPWRLLQPLIAAEAQAGEARELRQLKTLVESAPVTAAASA